MDEKLKDELREFGLLPLSLDELAQVKYRETCKKLGLEFDLSKIEMHFTPGIPQDVLQKQQAILTNVDRLHEMEVKGQTACADYTGLVIQIKDDLSYIRAQGYCKKATGRIALTGVDGLIRDPLGI